ncbi:MAG: phospholipase [Verrucomicrobia bacterium]|nr:phospholipase [Verrucomicrobiota bacterium]
MKLVAGITLWTAAALSPLAQTPGPDGVQKDHAFTTTVSQTHAYRYLQFLPKGYTEDPARRWPLILFLHGAGEHGTNVWLASVHGPPKIVRTKPEFPFIVVSPQCPPGSRWDAEPLRQLLNHVEASLRVDKSRVYLTGLSMGGYGTWSLGLRHPDRFAAIAPICGGGERIDVMLGSRSRTEPFKSLPIWVFHGAKDTVVPLSESERMVEAVRQAGNTRVKLTVYPEAQHDSWTETYDNPALYEWFFSHRR